MPDVDPRRCPLCGGPNDCGIAAGASTCWCFTTEIPSDVRDRIPPDARDLACVCRACAERQTPQGAQAAADDSNA
jgi:cysteine-rich CWC protein